MSTDLCRKQSRAWMLTVPEKEHTQADIEERLQRYARYVGQLEEGTERGYRHFQIYLEHDSPIRFSTLKNLLPTAHLETRRGTVREAFEYCSKEDTRVGEVFQKGVFDFDVETGKRTDLERYHEEILDGAEPDDVILRHPKAARYFMHLTAIAAARDRKNAQGQRELRVYFMHGASGSGKTSYLYARYAPEQLYRVTAYKHPFDSYRGQEVLVLDEFYGQIPIDYLLNVLDRYPLELEARYANRWAAFTTVWLVSNVPLEHLYIENPMVTQEQRRALHRRIHEVIRVDGREDWEKLDTLPDGGDQDEHDITRILDAVPM